MTHVRTPLRAAAFCLAPLLMLWAATPASAGGLPKDGAACPALSQTVGSTGDWLGHFTGGRVFRVATGGTALDWRDDYACFPTRLDCRRWQHDLLVAYRGVQGYKTCLPLR